MINILNSYNYISVAFNELLPFDDIMLSDWIYTF